MYAPRWTTRHDTQLLQAVHKHGLESAPAAAAAQAGSPVTEFVNRLLDAESGPAREARRNELLQKMSKRAPECLRRLPGVSAAGGGGASKKPSSRANGSKSAPSAGCKRKKGAGDSDGDLSDFQQPQAAAAKRQAPKWSPKTFALSKGPLARSELILVNPGECIPKDEAFRPCEDLRYSVICRSVDFLPFPRPDKRYWVDVLYRSCASSL